MEREEPAKAYGYTRVSTGKQVDGASHEVQKKAIEEYAERHNIQIVGWYWDGGVSAKTAHRPQLQCMLDDIQNKKDNVKYVVVYNTSRISRNLMSFSGDIAPVLARNNVELRSTQENFDNSPEGKFMQNLTISLHQLDNDTKSRTVRDNMCEVAKQGYWQGHEPIGMVLKHIPIGGRDRSGKLKYRVVLEPDPENGSKMRELLLRYRDGLASLMDLVRLAKKMGLKFHGKFITLKGLRRAIGNPAYAGYICSDKLTNGEYVKAKWGGLISLQDHNIILARLNGKTVAKRVYHKNDDEYPLKGTLKHVCGAWARGSAPRNGSGNHNPRYHCQYCKGANGGTMSVEEVHELFLELLESITPVEELLRLFKVILSREIKDTTSKNSAKIVSLKEQLSEIGQQKDISFREYMSGKHTKDEYEHYISLLDNDTNKINREIEKLSHSINLSERKLNRLIDIMRNPATVWNTGTLEARQLIQSMIFPNGVPIDFKQKKIGTVELSPLYSVIQTKNDPKRPDYGHMVSREGLEPSTPSLRGSCSNQLSYRPSPSLYYNTLFRKNKPLKFAKISIISQ